MKSFMPNLGFNTQYVPAGNANTSKQVLLAGQKNTNGVLTPPKAGYTNIDYYKPYVLPSFASGIEALKYISNLGINYQLGISYTYDFGNTPPSAVTYANGITTLQWNTPPFNFTALTNMNLTGTLTQATLSAPVKEAQIVDIQGLMVAQLLVFGKVAFTTSANCTLNTINAIQYPDPNNSDPIACMVFDFYQSALSAYPSPISNPNAVLSVLADRDNSISPTSSALDIGTPTTATMNPDGSATLIYTIPSSLKGNAYLLTEDGGNVETEDGANILLESATAPQNLGYLPQGLCGNSTITQGSASGLYAGYQFNGNTIIITVLNTTGTFNATADVNVVLDSSANFGVYLDNVSLHSAVMQFPINTLNDITTKHADFYSISAIINGQNQGLLGHYGTYFIAGNATIQPYNVTNLPVPNNVNYILVSYPYSPAFGDTPYENTFGNLASGRFASAFAYMIANGDPAFPALQSVVINHLPVSSSKVVSNYSSKSGGTGDLACGQGWIPLTPNSAGGVTILQSITTMVTVNGIPDDEFRYTHVQDCLRWLRNQIAVEYISVANLPDNQGANFISPDFTDTFKASIVKILSDGENLGMFENVKQYAKQVTVTQDQNTPMQVDVFVPCQIIPQLIGANVELTVYSSLYQFSGGN